MPKGKTSKKGSKGTTKRGRRTAKAEVRKADIERMKKYGVPTALLTALASGGYKAKPVIERELKKYFTKQDPSVIRKLKREHGDDIAFLKKNDFGNVLAPTQRYPANNVIAMNDPFSRIYTYDAPHTWGHIHDQASNLSGFPWYKGQEPTLAVKPSFGSKHKRKTTKKWVQTVIKRPGSLTAYAKKVAPRKAFTKRGTLKVAWLREVAKSDKSEMRRRQARLALRLKKMPKRGRKNVVKRKVKRKTTKKPKRKVVRKKKSLKTKFGSRDKPLRNTSFNYTIQQYGNNAGTPNLNQMHKLSGVGAYEYPITGPSAGGNLAWFESKSNNAGMGTW